MQYQVTINDTTTINFGKKALGNQAFVESVQGPTVCRIEGTDKSITVKPCSGKGNPFMVVVDGDQSALLKGYKGQTITLVTE